MNSQSPVVYNFHLPRFPARLIAGVVIVILLVILIWTACYTNVSSAQFLFDPDEFAYIKKNWVFLDHDQRLTGSAGISYTWKDWRASIDGLYGNGLRRGFANTQKNHPYETFNISLSRRIQLTEKTALKIRFDVVNLFDKVYELRDGSGIGVGAPQFGQRRGFYGTVAYDF